MIVGLDIYGAEVPDPVREADRLSSLRQNFLAIVAAGVGGYFWKAHRVLGALAGYSLVSNGYSVLDGKPRAAAGANVLAMGVGIVTSLVSPKAKIHPGLGFVGGYLGGSLIVGRAIRE